MGDFSYPSPYPAPQHTTQPAAPTPYATDVVRLSVLFRGNSLRRSFQIDLFKHQSVEDLRVQIFIRYGSFLRADEDFALRLYRVTVANDKELSRLDIWGQPVLYPREILGDLFPNPPGETEYILVDVGMMLR